jgi:hypothetical protein
MTEWTIATLKEHFEALRKEDHRAVDHQALEYERRLTQLNGEHHTLAQMKDTYVPREVYDRDQERARDEAKSNAASAIVNRRTMVFAIAGLAAALVGWGIILLVHFVPGVRS